MWFSLEVVLGGPSEVLVVVLNGEGPGVFLTEEVLIAAHTGGGPGVVLIEGFLL